MNYGHVVANRRYLDLGMCVACGLVPAAHRHHRDGDSYHNEPGNVAFLCRACHVDIHRRPAATHCRHGHAFTPENTAINSQGRRICRACKRENTRAYYARRKNGV